MVLSKKYFLPERIEKITAEENGSRNLLVRTVLSHVVDKLDYAEIIDVSVNQVLNSLMPMQDAGLDVDLTQAKSKTLKVLQKCVQAASEFAPAAAQKNVLSHSQIHFQETLKQLKLLYKSYVALDKQYSKAVKEHSEIVVELESEMLEGEEQDEKVVEASKVSARSTELKKIRDYKMSQIYQLLEKRYPDIVGYAQNVQSQKSKSIAMHKLELDADIIKGKPDHTKSSKFIADLLQICQAWLPLFWSLIPHSNLLYLGQSSGRKATLLTMLLVGSVRMSFLDMRTLRRFLT